MLLFLEMLAYTLYWVCAGFGMFHLLGMWRTDDYHWHKWRCIEWSLRAVVFWLIYYAAGV